jgi:hypothetical protein
MERAVQIFAAINFLALGLSHVVQHRVWKEFFIFLHARGNVGNILNAFLALGMGSLILGFHRVWSGVPLILTIYGIAATAKGALYLAVPRIGLSSIEKATAKDSRLFIVPGVMLMALGAALLWHVFR